MVHSQKKGKRGEDEFCKWFNKKFNKKHRREHFQSSGHDSDVMTDDFIFEVKRRETLNLDAWWYQVIISSKNHPDQDLIPCVVYRQNFKQWNFLLPASLIGLETGYIQLSAKVFIKFANTIVDATIPA